MRFTKMHNMSAQFLSIQIIVYFETYYFVSDLVWQIQLIII